MAGKIIDTGAAERRIKDIGAAYPLLDPAEVAKALGAVGTGTKLELTLGPIS